MVNKHCIISGSRAASDSIIDYLQIVSEWWSSRNRPESPPRTRLRLGLRKMRYISSDVDMSVRRWERNTRVWPIVSQSRSRRWCNESPRRGGAASKPKVMNPVAFEKALRLRNIRRYVQNTIVIKKDQLTLWRKDKMGVSLDVLTCSYVAYLLRCMLLLFPQEPRQCEHQPPE